MNQSLDISPVIKGKIELASKARYLLFILLVLLLPLACSAKPPTTSPSTNQPSSNKSPIEANANSQHTTTAQAIKNKKVAGPTSTTSKGFLLFPLFETQTTTPASETKSTKRPNVGPPIPILSWFHHQVDTTTTTQQPTATPGTTEKQTTPTTTTDSDSSKTPEVPKTPTPAPPSKSPTNTPSQPTTTTGDTHTSNSGPSPTTTTTVDDPMVSVQMLSPSTSIAGTRTITLGTLPRPSDPTSPHAGLHDPSTPTVIVLVPPGSQNLTLGPPGQIIVLRNGDKGVVANTAASVLTIASRGLLLVWIFAAVVLM